MGTLDPDDTRRIVLHETAHLQRRDDVTGLVVHLCGAIFWFNPFVHVIAKKLSLECEIACDETVVGQTGDATRYATLLFEMAETMTQRDQRLAWSGFAHPCGLVTRIQALLLYRSVGRRALPRPALAVLTAFVLSTAGLAAFSAPALGRAGDDPSVRVLWAVTSDPHVRNEQVTHVGRRVRAFPACTTHTARGAHDGQQFCEESQTRSQPATVKVVP